MKFDPENEIYNSSDGVNDVEINTAEGFAIVTFKGTNGIIVQRIGCSVKRIYMDIVLRDGIVSSIIDGKKWQRLAIQEYMLELVFPKGEQILMTTSDLLVAIIEYLKNNISVDASFEQFKRTGIWSNHTLSDAKTTYPMCKPQPAQVDCRKTGCKFHENATCIDPAPAITLNENDKFVCWSFKNKNND